MVAAAATSTAELAFLLFLTARPCCPLICMPMYNCILEGDEEEEGGKGGGEEAIRKLNQTCCTTAAYELN